jgi:Na+/H+-dicarboxylate symporter
MIIGLIIIGISDLGKGAAKLLAITAGFAYTSTVVGGFLAFFVSTNIFKTFITKETISYINLEPDDITPFFKMSINPMLEVTQSLIFAFSFGLCISILKQKNSNSGSAIYNVFKDFSDCIKLMLSRIIVPFLPLYICATFAKMTHSGQVFGIFNIFWKVILIVLFFQLSYVLLLFLLASLVSKKKFFFLIKNQILGYTTALGTQSSAATISANIECASKNKVSKSVREFVIPLCANINLPGSIITVTSSVVAVMMINSMKIDFLMFYEFLFTLSIVMVAAPAVPGGAVMSALPFLSMVGISSDSNIASLVIAIYIAQDSLGTAANVSADNAIAILVDTIHKIFNKDKIT